MVLILNGIVLKAQDITTAKAHSHNDYMQQSPFHLAYNEMFGSIEADIHLVNNKILVGHDTKDLDSANTLEKLYLQPIVSYNFQDRKLQLLIDVKTEPISTINQLVSLLKKYPTIVNNQNIKIVLSGNAPPDSTFTQYPNFIWFDGRLNKNYTKAQLSKIALISEDYNKITGWKLKWPVDSLIEENIKQTVLLSQPATNPIIFPIQ